MSVEIKHYVKPRPKGATDSGLLKLIFGPFPILVGLFAGLSATQGEPLALAFLPMLPVGLYITWEGARTVWLRSPLASRSRDDRAGLTVSSGEDFALLLRPFNFDGAIPILPPDSRGIVEHDRVRKGMWIEDKNDIRPPIDLFDLLADALSTRIQLLAVGERSKEVRGGPGLVRVDDPWRPTVLDLLRRARHIFIMPWPSPGTLWELDQIIADDGLLEKAVFVMPPAYGIHHYEDMVTTTFLENSGQQHFYLKVPPEELSADHPAMVVRDGYLEAIAVLQAVGLSVPRYDSNGSLFRYREGRADRRQIPYSKTELRGFNDGLASSAPW